MGAGVQQRIRALELFIADAYGAGRIFVDRVVPRSVVTSSAHFHREVAGIKHQDGARIVISGIDLHHHPPAPTRQLRSVRG